jgi:hypothetical protein
MGQGARKRVIGVRCSVIGAAALRILSEAESRSEYRETMGLTNNE